MAGPGLPTTVGNGTTGRYSHVNTSHTYVNKLDTTFLTASNGQVPTYDTATGTYKPATPTSSSTATVPGWVNVKAAPYNATGNGSTDDSTAIIAARDAVLASRTSGLPSLPILYFPPGQYRITSPDALLPTGGTVIEGYTIMGSGYRTSKILFQPAGASSTLTNMNLITAVGSAQRLIGLRIEDIGFDSNNANASFAYLWSTATASVQDTLIRGVRFTGQWNRIFGLDGDSGANLNSEMTFERVQVTGSSTTLADAFLHAGLTAPSTNTQQDQFCNYWFYDCKMEPSTGDMVVFDRGGHIHVHGGSWLHSGAGGGTHFKMTGNFSRADSTQYLSVHGVRFELRNANSRVIDCQWRHGNVTFINCSDDAFGFNYQINGTGAGLTNFDTHIYRSSNNTMPTIRYQDCGLMGYHRVVTTATVPTPGKIIYDGCGFKNMQAGGASTLAGATSEFLRYDSAAPHYRYQDCRLTTDVNT